MFATQEFTQKIRDDTDFIHVNLSGLDKKGLTKTKSTYLPLKSKDGKKLSIKFDFQLLANTVRLNKYGKLQLAFKRFTESELADSKLKNHSKLLEKNNEFIEMLDLVSDRYETLASELLKDKRFALCNKNISHFKQGETSEGVALEQAIYRVTLPYDAQTKRVVTKYQDKSTEIIEYLNKNQVFPKETNTTNVSDFLTYRSVLTGILTFDCLVISNFGVSLQARIKTLKVLVHPKIVKELMTAEEIDENNDLIEPSIDDDDMD